MFGGMFLLASLAAVMAATDDGFFYVRQDASKKGVVGVMSGNNGEVVAESKESFTFTWPYVEITSDRAHDKLFVVTFPDDHPNGPVLYQFDKSLNVNHVWSNVNYSFFDLQYSPKQSTLYGIKVTSTYGRVLSNFTADKKADDVYATELFTLPYMWYVNASSYHAEKNVYFGLINYFPGHPESVLDQQLVVANFDVDVAKVPVSAQVVPLSAESGIWQFIAFSTKLNALVFSSRTKPYEEGDEVIVGVADVTTGKAKTTLLRQPGFALGPLVVQDEHNRALVYLQPVRDGAWELWSLSLTATEKPKRLRVFTSQDYHIFSAASHGLLA